MKVRAAHASEHKIVFDELDIGVLNDLHAVSPRISELYPASRNDLRAGLLETLTHLLFVVHHQAKWRSSS